jgi:O-antigen ligase
MAAAALAFAANMAFVAMSRTAIVSIVVLAGLFAVSVFGWRRAVAAIAVFAILAGLAWSLSPYLRARASAIIQEVSAYREGREVPSGGRLEFWSRSLAFLHASPVIGTGTGSIRDTFRRNSPDPAREIASNPHNQIFAVGIQLGAAGIAVLLAMWAAHLAFFAAVPGTVGWFGLTVVTQNIVSSLFNSHLMDFTQSWLYVLGVGIAGGMVLRARKWRPAP